jgi:outer membrane immunogenic protein
MKKLLLSATAIATVISVSAIAADLPSIKSAPVAPAPMWTGFYAGLNSGYGWGLTPGSYTQSPLFYDEESILKTGSPSGLGAANSGKAIINQSGYLGGGQIGYNYQFMHKYIIGLETDMQGSAISGQGYYSGAGVTKQNVLNSSQFNTVGYGQTQASINWLGTLRGRLGYLVTPTLLTFVTGGLSYGGVSARNYFGSQTLQELVANSQFQSQQALAGNGRASETLMGWNIGGGAEWMLAPNWSIKSEILYYNLGTLAFSGWGYSPAPQGVSASRLTQAVSNSTTANFAGIIARAGLNYHIGSDGKDFNSTALIGSLINPVKQHNTTESLTDWSGMYLGLNAGYGWSGHGVQTTSDAYNQYANSWNSNAGITVGSVQPINGLAQANSGWSSVNQSGFLGGLQAGYNYQFGKKIVIGLETDIQGSSMNGSSTYSGAAKTDYWRPAGAGQLVQTEHMVAGGDVQAGMNWFGTLRGRVGYLITPTFLTYATGGLSYGGVYAQTNFISSSNVISNLNGSTTYAQILSGKGQATNSLVGWNAGAGAEWMLISNWSLKTEAIYYDLGSMLLTGNGYSPTVTDSTIRGQYQAVNTKTSIRYNGVIARMGVNYHFDFGKSAPVVAKF